MKTTEDERQYYLRVANDLDAMNFPGPKQDADFLRGVIGDVAMLEMAIRTVLPLYTSEGCWYCYKGDLRISSMMHVTDGQENKCLYHPSYTGARAVLGIPNEKKTICDSCECSPKCGTL